MATKTELFVIAIKNVNGETSYLGINKAHEVVKVTNPTELSKCFTKEDADTIKEDMKKKGLEEGTKVRVKAITQATRDYCGVLLEKVKETALAGEKAVKKVRELYKVEEEKVEEENKEEIVKEEEVKE